MKKVTIEVPDNVAELVESPEELVQVLMHVVQMLRTLKLKGVESKAGAHSLLELAGLVVLAQSRA